MDRPRLRRLAARLLAHTSPSSLATLLVAVAVASTASASAQRPVRVTFVGDSVPAALDYVGVARDELERGLDVRLDLRVCRRLATPGCPYHGKTPSSVLDVVRAAGRTLGDVLVVDVGYNEGSAGYQEGMDQVIRAADGFGVHGIVWVTLRETRTLYRQTNEVIRDEARHYPGVWVADWNAWSHGKPWFGRDGLHLNAAGADGLATLLRPYLARAAHARGGATAPATRARRASASSSGRTPRSAP